jgi:hypothetical protein
MKYNDYLDETTKESYINNHYVGARQSSPIGDKLNPTQNGNEVYSNSVRFGTSIGDSKANKPIMVEDIEEIETGSEEEEMGRMEV